MTPWTVAHQAPFSMGFSRQEYWSGLPCPPPGDLEDLGIEPASVTSPAVAGGFFFFFFFTKNAPRETPLYVYLWLIHVDVLQTPTQYCKAIVLQLKINKLRKLGLLGRELEQEGAAGGSEVKGSLDKWTLNLLISVFIDVVYLVLSEPDSVGNTKMNYPCSQKLIVCC